MSKNDLAGITVRRSRWDVDALFFHPLLVESAPHMYHRLPAVLKPASSQSEDQSTLSVSCTTQRLVMAEFESGRFLALHF